MIVIFISLGTSVATAYCETSYQILGYQISIRYGSPIKVSVYEDLLATLGAAIMRSVVLFSQVKLASRPRGVLRGGQIYTL